MAIICWTKGVVITILFFPSHFPCIKSSIVNCHHLLPSSLSLPSSSSSLLPIVAIAAVAVAVDVIVVANPDRCRRRHCYCHRCHRIASFFYTGNWGHLNLNFALRNTTITNNNYGPYFPIFCTQALGSFKFKFKFCMKEYIQNKN